MPVVHGKRDAVDAGGAVSLAKRRSGGDSSALIVGHTRDPVHPFSDSGMLAEELPNGRLVEASSILEWRLSPKRLNAELAAFLEEASAHTTFLPGEAVNGDPQVLDPGRAVSVCRLYDSSHAG